MLVQPGGPARETVAAPGAAGSQEAECAPHTHTPGLCPHCIHLDRAALTPPPVWHVNGCTAQRTNPVKESKAPQASGGKQQASVRGRAPPGTALCPAQPRPVPGPRHGPCLPFHDAHLHTCTLTTRICISTRSPPRHRHTRPGTRTCHAPHDVHTAHSAARPALGHTGLAWVSRWGPRPLPGLRGAVACGPEPQPHVLC